jgi:hypothetical protein
MVSMVLLQATATATATLNSQLPLCQFKYPNSCQGKDSGGHSNSIFSTVDGYCAKKIKIKKNHSNLELEFYKRLHSLAPIPILSFFPQFGGQCQNEKGQVFLKVENVKADFKNPWEMDLKMGAFTSSKQELKENGKTGLALYRKLFTHGMLDKYLSSSRRHCFRITNKSIDRSRPSFLLQTQWDKLKMKKFPLPYIEQYLQHPLRSKAFHQKLKQCFSHKLAQLYQALQEPGLEDLTLIGSSLLFIYPYDGLEEDLLLADTDQICKVKIIDFAHSYIRLKAEPSLSGHADGKFIQGHRQGVKGLRDFFLAE